ncbi:TIGR01440 family protein [Intestinimonas sp. MSJ-38]|uniref:TIGR01440 family protein n=1 Tax=Intestinimonas sp. MSJ-38 TaxID=2841532 RepID=UPI00209EE936|nr:TIGR01440 family protein [Intestinimonas sp. MSJ-38]
MIGDFIPQEVFVMYEEITGQARQAVTELLERARLEPGDIFVVGCSSSEVGGHRIGSDSSPEVAQAILDGIYPILKEKGIYLAAQCCEHLNRAIVLEKEAARAYGLVPVNVVPQPKAGGSFATAAYKAFSHPVMVEHVKAAAGIDIGGTLIGMHLREVAVPTRLSIKQIGEANIICARTRPKFIGGQRAHYDESQM